MATTISKSALIENVFNFWMEHNYTSEVEEKSYQDFSKIMYSKYLDLQVTRRALNYSFFLNEIKKELEYKGLTIPVIKKILDYIDKEHLKNKI
jgi:hypothetical protein